MILMVDILTTLTGKQEQKDNIDDILKNHKSWREEEIIANVRLFVNQRKENLCQGSISITGQTTVTNQGSMKIHPNHNYQCL